MRTVVVFTVLVVSAFAVDAHAATKFLGWHASGAFYYQQVDDKVRVCREDASDIPSGFPEGTNIGPGSACGDLPAEMGAMKALDYAKKDLKGATTAKKNSFGVDVKLEQKDNKATVFVVDGPDKKEKLGDIGATEPLKISDVQWRNDGRAVAVVVEPAKPVKGAPATSTLFIGDVSKLLVGGPAGRKRAEQLHAQGQALMKKRDWSGAGKRFEEAIEADAEWAQARYARAAAEAQGGVGRTAMIENLQWLKDASAKDASAKKLLAGAKDDHAFDSWAGEPEVRELLGLPAVGTMDVTTRLLERKGVWTLQGATCKAPWITLAFKKGDAKKGAPVTMTVAEACKGKKTPPKSAAGVYGSPAGGPFEIQFKKPIEGQPAKAVIVLDGSYQQLKLQPESGDPIGPFEPGAARIEDSAL
jgi:hypothetical protein